MGTGPDSDSGQTGGTPAAAGEGRSDDELIDEVAGQTDSASPNADTAGRNWDGESEPPAPPS